MEKLKLKLFLYEKDFICNCATNNFNCVTTFFQLKDWILRHDHDFKTDFENFESGHLFVRRFLVKRNEFAEFLQILSDKMQNFIFKR